MIKRVFPFNQKDNQWQNRQVYLQQINTDIDSLKFYLGYFNPDYILYNNTMHYIDASTNKEYSISYTNIPNNIIVPTKGYGTFIDIHGLKWREGYFNESENYYLVINQEKFNEVDKDNITKEQVVELSQNMIIKPFPPQSSAFVAHWPHTNSEEEFNSPEDFMFISQPAAALYNVTPAGNGLTFTLVEDGQRIMGTDLMIRIEKSPSRYFLTNETASFWTGGISWDEENFIVREGKRVPHIQNIKGGIWNGAPIMHEAKIGTEEFIFDNDWTTTIGNFESQTITHYNISAKEITTEETQYWKKDIHIVLL